jgi:putative ABC transport system ATP-binding protein
MIKLENLNVIFNQGTQLENWVLRDINLQIEEGEFVTIIGGNGAGKSTLMNVMTGDISVESGKVIIDGQDVTKLNTENRSSFIARIFQDPMLGTFAELSIEENLSLAYNRGRVRGLSLALRGDLRAKFKEAMSELGMGLEQRLNDKVALLSGGQRQVLSLIMATLQGSKLLLLDEHTAALDPKTAKTVLELTASIIERRKLTSLMITHSMTHALEYGNRTLMMYHGQIIRDMKEKERMSLSPTDLIKFFDL